MPERVRKYRYTPGQTAIVRLVWMLVGTALAAMTLFPLLWMVSIAFKTQSEMFDMAPRPGGPDARRTSPTCSPQVDFLRYLLNTFFVAATVTVVALFFHSMAGYALARLRFPGREAIFLTMFSTFLVSLPVIIVPLFILVRAIGHAEHLRRPDHPGDLQRLRHLPPAAVLPVGPARARGGGADRRRRLLAHLLEHHPAAQPADPRRRSRSSSSSPTGMPSSGR